MSRSTKRRRNVLLQSWLTPVEAQTVRRKAADAGVSVSEFMRSALFRYKPRPRTNTEALSKLGGEMGKIGSNLNQIAYQLNRQGMPVPEAVDTALRNYVEIQEAILQALGKRPNGGAAV